MAKMRPLMVTSLVFLLACCIHSIQGQDQEIKVETKLYGSIRGRVREADNGAKVNMFLGVPYATPPVGDLRFKHTVSRPQVKGDFEAVKMPPACPQYSEVPLPWYDLDPGQSEDCLYLNIWAPANKGKKARPVKVYVHGGGWLDAGSIRMPYYDGFGEAVDTYYENGTSKEDGIVVVTVNYRLGVLGFLASSNDDEAPGNAGLTDVLEAISWIQDNIIRFGGSDGYWNNRDYITVEGQGTGALLVTMVRFLTWRSFKMVLNGATFFSLQAFAGADSQGDIRPNNYRLTDALAQELGCGSQNTSNYVIECLREVEASRLVRVAASLSQSRGPPNVFLPFTNNTAEPIWDDILLGKLQKNNVYYFNWTKRAFDTLATFTSDDGSALLTTTFPKVFGAFGEKDVPLSAACAKKVTRRFLSRFPVTVADELLGDLDRKATTSNRDKVTQAFSDAYFNCPMVFYAEDLKLFKSNTTEDIVKVYILEKQVYPPYNPWAPWMGSVGFNNVQISFKPQDGQLAVNNQTYKYTDEQSEQVRVNLDVIQSLMRKRELPIPEFFLENPSYGVLKSDSTFLEKSDLHKRNCDILRPYFNRAQKTRADFLDTPNYY